MKDSVSNRLIDRFVGVALCYTLSWGRILFNLLKKPDPDLPGKKKKILLVEFFEMGAAIMIAPSVLHIKKVHPDAEIHCLTTKSCAEAWKLLKIFPEENIAVVNNSSALQFILSILPKIAEMRRINFDIIIDYELFMRVSSVVIGMLRGQRKVGYYKYEMEALNRGAIYDRVCSFNQNQHVAKNFLALTKVAIGTADDHPNFKGRIENAELTMPPPLGPTPVETPALKALIENRGKPFIVLCPDVGQTLAVRNYPAVNYQIVVRELLKRLPECTIGLIGTFAESSTSDAICRSAASDRVINLCGKTSFSDLLKVISLADLLICNDNGPGHFAALTGTRTLSLFSAETPFIYGPMGRCVVLYSYFQCSPCVSAFNHKRTKCKNNLCIQAISPEEVVDYACLTLADQVTFQTVNNKIPYLL